MSLLKRIQAAVGAVAVAASLAGAALSLAPAQALAGAGDKVSTAPTLHNGKKWRIGYMEGGQYPDYETITKATVRGLIKLGWIEPIDLPKEINAEAGGFWRWLAANAKSQYIEFVPDAYYAAGNFDEKKRPQMIGDAVARIKDKTDIDLMLAMGTWAGLDLAKAPITTPIVVGSTSNPIGAGIVTSAEDSGRDNVHAKVEPERYQKQVQLFHDIMGFKTLGIVYDDSMEGRTFGGVDAVEQVAKERGFTIVRCNAPYVNLEQPVVEKGVVDCYAKIAAQVDAIYITVHRGVTKDSLPKIMAAINAKQVPTFSMLGSSEVRRGVLMSIAQADFSYVGQFHADVIAKIFNGAKPREIDQRWNAPPKIALNLKEAEVIGYDPPVDIMMASDEIYENIE